jgi:hypothetical protein
MMPETEIIQTKWWLMDCSFPSLNWARLRVHLDGRADVLDMDGCMMVFDSQEDAVNHLLEDEYVSLERLTDEDYAELRLDREQLMPPAAQSDRELAPKMFMMRG